MSLVATVLVAGGLLAGPWMLLRRGRLPPPEPMGDRAVSIVVPARDEAAALPALLASVAALDPPPHEVIVVDDGSSDGSGDVAAAHGATVVTAPPLPDGWLGKPWACHVGAAAATGTHLLFLDADTSLAPDALGRLVAAAPDGLLSVQPHHLTERASEQLSAFPNLVALMGGGAFAPWPRPARPVAYGPCLLLGRSDHDRIGGHEAVRDSVVEDVQLAQRAADAGLAVRSCRGGTTVTFRMYAEGLAPLVEGWTKNLAPGAGGAPRVAVAATVWWVAACAAVGAAGVADAIRWIAGGPVPWTAAAAWAVVSLELFWCLRRAGRFRWWTSAAFFVPLTAFVALFVRSSAKALLSRPATWRGREVDVRAG